MIEINKICLKALRFFGWRPFPVNELAEKLGYSEGYIRNIVSEAVKGGGLLAQTVEDDKRKKLLRVNPEVVRDAVMKGGREKESIIDALGLIGEYSGKYVALVNGEVVDYDKDLYTLTDRIFTKFDPDEVVVTNVGRP